jgi:hypothetical protein
MVGDDYRIRLEGHAPNASVNHHFLHSGAFLAVFCANLIIDMGIKIKGFDTPVSGFNLERMHLLAAASAENIRCLCENEDTILVYQIINTPYGTKSAIIYVIAKEVEMLIKLKTGTNPLPPQD